MRHRPRALTLAALVALACSGEVEQKAREEKELGPYMSNLQRYSQKLGYSIGARNSALAEFYLEEVEEVLEAVERKVPEHDGIPIAKNIGETVLPRLAPLEESLAARDWDRALADYEALIDGCNLCHQISEHPFVRVLPAAGEPPFNQRFEP